ncbi:MAG TPA: hypothetical protein VN260_00820, partial [Dissulfurispiraceae bacterium]|nr:hypothetical protein [Dissulfurispiraceae bacterium]
MVPTTAVTSLIILLIPCVVLAAPGDFDRTFNAPSGLVFYDPGESGNAVAVQDDGGIIVAGTIKSGGTSDVLILRYDSSGVLDPSFGSKGAVTYGLPARDESATAVAVQHDGRIVVAGAEHNGSNNDVLVLRYNSDGTPDTTFGTGGVFTYNAPANSDDFAKAVALQPESGKIVVAGGTYNGKNTDVLTLTLNTNGTLDTAFGAGGVVVYNGAADGDDVGEALAVQRDGKIVVAGGTFNGSDNDVLLLRYTPDGAPDVTFAGGDGVASFNPSSGTNEAAKAVSLQRDGKIVVAGGVVVGSSIDLLVLRYNGNGLPDAGFGTGGAVIYGGGSTNESARSLSVQADGKIVVGGIVQDTAQVDGIIIRYDDHGVPDPAFGSGGVVTFGTSLGSSDYINALLMQRDGKIVATGRTSPPAIASSDIVVMRVTGQEFMEPPTGMQTFSCPATVAPVRGVDPELAWPIGTGPFVAGGDVVNIRVGLTGFSSPVDMYVIISAPSLSSELWLMGPDGGLQPASSGIVKWKDNTARPVDASLFGDIPLRM